jgi:hypothetical protein
VLEKMTSYDKDSEDEEQVKLTQYNNAAPYFLTMSCGENSFPYVDNANGDTFMA